MLLSQFEDQAQGGFYFTSADHEALLQRPKPMADESTPSGNGIAALSLQRLGHLLGEPRYLDAAARTLVAAAEPIRRLPYAHATLLMALDEQLNPPEIIVIRGHAEAADAPERERLGPWARRRLSLAAMRSASGKPWRNATTHRVG